MAERRPLVVVSGQVRELPAGDSLPSSGGGLSPGDVLTTARTLAAPNWLKCDGAQYLRASYPAVEGLLPPPPADGVTWTQRTLPTSANWYSVTYGNGVFVAVASGSSTAATSTDGITWTSRTLPTSANWCSVTYGNGVFVAVAYSGTIAATSPDGVTWTQRTLPTSDNWISVTYGNGVFVAVAQDSTIAATSSGDSTKFRVPLIADPALCRTYIKATA